MKQKLIEDYPNVFANKLTGDHMHIPKISCEVKPESTKPSKAYTCREPPIHWRAPAQKLIQELLEQQIITEHKPPSSPNPLEMTSDS